jgi:hypothetical protein
MAWQIGVDVGGTFTDLLALDPERGVFRVAKVPSTPEDQSIGFIAGLAELPRRRTLLIDAGPVSGNDFSPRRLGGGDPWAGGGSAGSDGGDCRLAGCRPGVKVRCSSSSRSR